MVYMYTCIYKCCILHNGNVVPFNYLTIPFQSSWNSDTEVKSELVSITSAKCIGFRHAYKDKGLKNLKDADA